MLYVSLLSFMVWVNGDYIEKVKLDRELYHGDPLSPFLYLFCTKTVTRHSRKMAATKKMLFPQIAPRGGRVELL